MVCLHDDILTFCRIYIKYHNILTLHFRRSTSREKIDLNIKEYRNIICLSNVERKQVIRIIHCARKIPTLAFTISA